MEGGASLLSCFPFLSSLPLAHSFCFSPLIFSLFFCPTTSSSSFCQVHAIVASILPFLSPTPHCFFRLKGPCSILVPRSWLDHPPSHLFSYHWHFFPPTSQLTFMCHPAFNFLSFPPPAACVWEMYSPIAQWWTVG